MTERLHEPQPVLRQRQPENFMDLYMQGPAFEYPDMDDAEDYVHFSGMTVHFIPIPFEEDKFDTQAYFLDHGADSEAFFVDVSILDGHEVMVERLQELSDRPEGELPKKERRALAKEFKSLPKVYGALAFALAAGRPQEIVGLYTDAEITDEERVLIDSPDRISTYEGLSFEEAMERAVEIARTSVGIKHRVAESLADQLSTRLYTEQMTQASTSSDGVTFPTTALILPENLHIISQLYSYGAVPGIDYTWEKTRQSQYVHPRIELIARMHTGTDPSELQVAHALVGSILAGRFVELFTGKRADLKNLSDAKNQEVIMNVGDMTAWVMSYFSMEDCKELFEVTLRHPGNRAYVDPILKRKNIDMKRPRFVVEARTAVRLGSEALEELRKSTEELP